MSTVSLCNYIFGKEAEKIFENVKIKSVTDKRAFIEQCLQLSMRVNSYLFQKDGSLPLYSANAGNEGCHLYSYRILHIKQTYHLKTDEEKLAMTEENRFLLLSFFLSFMLLSDVNQCFITVFHKTMEAAKLKSPTPVKYFNAFLLDEGKRREKASREAYNQIFQSFLKDSLEKVKDKDEVYAELYGIANEKLMKESKSFSKISLYTYPTFPALVLLEKIIQEEKLPIFIKAKIITKGGVIGTIKEKFGKAQGNDPVLVLEGFGTDTLLTEPRFREMAKQCANFYRRDEKQMHAESANCALCKPVEGNLEPFQKRFKAATQSLETLFQALGVDSLNSQEEFKALFTPDNYPNLTKIQTVMQTKIEELGVGAAKPLTFTICHAHVNDLAHANQDELFLDTPPKKFLKRLL